MNKLWEESAEVCFGFLRQDPQVCKGCLDDVVLAVAHVGDDVVAEQFLRGEPVEAQRVLAGSAFSAHLQDVAQGHRVLAGVVIVAHALSGEVFGHVERGKRGGKNRERKRAQVLFAVPGECTAQSFVEANPTADDFAAQGLVWKGAQEQTDPFNLATVTHLNGYSVYICERELAPEAVELFGFEPVFVIVQSGARHTGNFCTNFAHSVQAFHRENIT